MQNAVSPLFSGIISRIMAAIIALISFFTIAKPDNVILTVTSVSPESVTVEFKNGTGNTISPEQYFLLEEKTNGGWAEIPFVEDFYWIEIAEICPPAGTGTRTVNAENCFGHVLAPGDYRFTLYYTCDGAGISGGTRSVSVEFRVNGE